MFHHGRADAATHRMAVQVQWLAAEAAKRYARGGYDVIVDGIVGPWFLEPWLNIVQEHYEVH